LDGSRASDALLRAMTEQMTVARMNPSLRIWLDGPVGLAVLDYSRGASLPRTGDCILAADVRLDDARELGCSVSMDLTATEDALLLATLDAVGSAGLCRVLGDFAFAHWNAKNQILTCGRDAMGIRPLAYVHDPGRLFAFASLPRALYGCGIVKKQIDEAALARRITRRFRFDDSLVLGIKRLPPAHVIAVSDTGAALERYWQIDRSKLGTRRCSPEEAARDLRAAVDQAVACRLACCGETGAHLSGGLDSSSIAVLAARRLRGSGQRLHAYSFLDRQREDITLEDETEFVMTVLRQEDDIDWTPIFSQAALPARGDPLDADTMGSLCAEEPDNAVCARAEAQGVSVILSGWGGDEGATFNGRGSFAELFLRGRWFTLAREIAALKRERGWSASRIVYGEILSYVVPVAALELVRRIVRKGEGQGASFSMVLSDDARRHAVASDAPKALELVPDGRENRWRLMTSAHLAERTENWAHMGARHGLAFAFPMLDRRVIELALSLPSDIFLRDGFRRRPFRDAMADVLPARVRLRHEKYLPFPSYPLTLAESRAELLSLVDVYERNQTIRRILDLNRLRRLIEGFPTAEEVRATMRREVNPGASASMIGVAQALRTAEYIEQHFGTQPVGPQALGEQLWGERQSSAALSMSSPRR
jgi:asparagine synthase (glutamine-hydrolysing)